MRGRRDRLGRKNRIGRREEEKIDGKEDTRKRMGKRRWEGGIGEGGEE